MGGEEAHAHTLSPGTILDEKYRIDELIAVGGMGAVYLGTHTSLQKKVAIKLLRADLADNLDAIERFRREAIAASRIGHDNICEVTDLGETDWGASFLVMEHLEGQSLAEVIESKGRLLVPEACSLVLPILSAINAAHEQGIVHRDLKPANVFLAAKSSGDTIKVLDFGISRVQGGDGAELRLTQTGAILGTPVYMSPEQARGAPDIGPLSDVYSIGVLLYELLTGHLPFQDTNYNQLIFRVAAGEFPKPRELVPDLLIGMEEVLLKAMALRPEDRYQSAREFAWALVPFSGSETPTFLRANAPEPKPVTPGAQTMAMGTAETVVGQSQVSSANSQAEHTEFGQPRAKRWLLIPVVALLCFMGVWLASSLSRDTAMATSATPPSNRGAPKVEREPNTKAPAMSPERVTLSIQTKPSQAAVILDGRELLSRTIEVPADGKDHTLVVKATGYLEKFETLRFDVSQRVTVSLAPVKPAVAETTGEATETKKSQPRKIRKKKNKRLVDESPYE